MTTQDHYYEVPDGKILYGYIDDNGVESALDKMLAILLIEDQIFLNNHWWEDEWPEEAQDKTALCLMCSDVFAWGGADAEVIDYKDIEDVFNHWMKDKAWGTAVWCIKKRGVLPQKPVYDLIQKEGIWDLDVLELKANPGWNK